MLATLTTCACRRAPSSAANVSSHRNPAPATVDSPVKTSEGSAGSMDAPAIRLDEELLRQEDMLLEPGPVAAPGERQQPGRANDERRLCDAPHAAADAGLKPMAKNRPPSAPRVAAQPTCAASASGAQ